MIPTLHPLPRRPALDEHLPTLPLHLGNLLQDLISGSCGLRLRLWPPLVELHCPRLMPTLPALHLRRQLATDAGPPRLVPESATAPAVPPPQGRVGQAGAVSLDTYSASSWPDFWKANLPRSTLNLKPFYLLDLELNLWNDRHHDPFPGFTPAGLLRDSRSEDKYWGFCPLLARPSCPSPAASTNCPLGALCCYLEFGCVGEGLGLGPELPEATTAVGWASGRPGLSAVSVGGRRQLERACHRGMDLQPAGDLRGLTYG